LRTVEDRGLLWTGFALVDTQVVDMVLWARIAKFCLKVEKVGKETFYAGTVFCQVWLGLWALALLGRFAIS
jgi:hypothetical protein